MTSRAELLAEQLLARGHTIAWTCNATTLSRRAVHRVGQLAGMTWHPASDTMRHRPRQAKPVRELVDGIAELLDEQVTDPEARRVLRRELAVWVGRLERELYPTTSDPLVAHVRRRRRRTTREDTP